MMVPLEVKLPIWFTHECLRHPVMNCSTGSVVSRKRLVKYLRMYILALFLPSFCSKKHSVICGCHDDTPRLAEHVKFNGRHAEWERTFVTEC